MVALTTRGCWVPPNLQLGYSLHAPSMPDDANRSMKKLIIVGASATAEVMGEYFQHEAGRTIAAYAVERPFLDGDTFRDRPVVPLDTLTESFDPSTHAVFVAISYGQLNKLRERLLREVILMGYEVISFVSQRATIAPSATLGRHLFVFEQNNVQPFVSVEDNVVLWSGNHIGHHSTIGPNCFIASHVVVSGFCQIGANCFIGVNATIANNIEIGEDCWIGPGATVTKNLSPRTMIKGTNAEVSRVDTHRFFRITES